MHRKAVLSELSQEEQKKINYYSSTSKQLVKWDCLMGIVN